MLNIGPLEFLVIITIALLVVGPRELPQVARKIARFLGELRRQGEEVRSQVRDLIDEAIADEEQNKAAEADGAEQAPAGGQAVEVGDEPASEAGDTDPAGGSAPGSDDEARGRGSAEQIA